MGLSDGVYRGSVSTESAPWCLQTKGGGASKMGSVVRGESGGGSVTTVCCRPIPGSDSVRGAKIQNRK